MTFLLFLVNIMPGCNNLLGTSILFSSFLSACFSFVAVEKKNKR